MKLKIKAITLRDINKRKLFYKYELIRKILKLLLISNTVPNVIKIYAQNKLNLLPVNSSITKFRNRCLITTRPRGVIGDFRINRHIFKKFVRNGVLPGVKS